MVQTVHCVQCGGSSIPIGSVSVNIVLSKSAWCEHCYNSKTDNQHTFFCSTQCFHAYLLKVVNGEAEIKWKELKVVDGVVQLI